MIQSVKLVRIALSALLPASSLVMSMAGVSAAHAADEPSASAPGASADAQKKLVRSELAPHTVMIETALKSSQAEIEGIRSQLKAEEGRQSAEAIDHYKIYTKEIRDEVNTLATHQAHLKGMAQKYANVASSKEFREANAAIDEYRTLVSRWEGKAATSAYWNDRRQVTHDLESLSQRIDAAMSKTKGFNSSQLDVSTSLG